MAVRRSPAELIALCFFSLVVLCQPLAGQIPLTLEQAASRKAPDFAPAYEGQRVRVRGTVSSEAIEVLDYAHLPVQDESLYGLTVEGSPKQLAGYAPGDVLEMSGTLSMRAGLPVLHPSEIRKTGTGAAPRPVRVPVKDLGSNRYLGVLVTAEGRVTAVGENAGGRLLVIGDQENSLKVFRPHRRWRDPTAFSALQPGDRVAVTGISSQYCAVPPYDRFYQILINDTSKVVLVRSGWFVEPHVVLILLTGVVAAGFFWWLRERRMREQRRGMRALYTLSEEIMSAGSPEEILRHLLATLPRISQASGARLYLHNRKTNHLDYVRIPAQAGTPSVALDSQAGPALCFRNRALLAVSDTRRSPIYKAVTGGEPPRSVMFIPMIAESEPLGVMVIEYARGVRQFNPDQQAAAQHLGNQIAMALKVVEQQSIREQLFRSEKLAAAGQLVSGVVNELRQPLESMASRAARLLERRDQASLEQELEAISSEARRASSIVSRMVSFSKSEDADAKRVDLNQLLSSLIEFREPEWKVRGFEVRNLLSPEPLTVLGAESQLEQVILSLLVHAENALALAQRKTITVGTRLLARRVLIEIGYSGQRGLILDSDPFQNGGATDKGTVGLGVCQGIMRSHGGQIRFVADAGEGPRFEIELPAAPATPGEALDSPPATQRHGPHLTVLLIEPEEAVQRQLLMLLSERGHRVVPVSKSQEAADMAQRLQFDLAFCSVRLPGSNWVEFFDKVRHHVGAFVLLTEGVESDPPGVFLGDEGYVLGKPISTAEAERLLALIQDRLEKQPAIESRR